MSDWGSSSGGGWGSSGGSSGGGGWGSSGGSSGGSGWGSSGGGSSSGWGSSGDTKKDSSSSGGWGAGSDKKGDSWGSSGGSGGWGSSGGSSGGWGSGGGNSSGDSLPNNEIQNRRAVPELSKLKDYFKKHFQEKFTSAYPPALVLERQERDKFQSGHYTETLEGFGGLRKRVDTMDKNLQGMLSRAKLIQKRVDELKEQCTKNESDLEKLRKTQRSHSIRLLRVMKDIELLESQGQPLNSEERKLQSQLMHMEEELHSPQSIRTRLVELESALSMKGNENANENLQLSDEDRHLLSERLLSQVKGIEHLQHVLEWVKKDLVLMIRSRSNAHRHFAGDDDDDIFK